MNRRGFLKSILVASAAPAIVKAASVAPAIVKASSLMKIAEPKIIVPVQTIETWEGTDITWSVDHLDADSYYNAMNEQLSKMAEAIRIDYEKALIGEPIWELVQYK